MCQRLAVTALLLLWAGAAVYNRYRAWKKGRD